MLTCKKCGAQFEWGVSKCPECNKPVIMEVDFDADSESENDESESRLNSCATCGRQIDPQTGQCQVCAQRDRLSVDLEDETILLKPVRRRRFKAVLLTAAILFFLVGGLGLFQYLTNPEPEIIAIENSAFRPTDPASIITDPQTGVEMVAGELVIIAREGSTAEDINRIAASVGGQVIGRMADLNIYQIAIAGKDAQSINWAIQKVEEDPAVEIAKANYVPETLNDAQKKPKDSQWTEWSENRRWGQKYINLPEAWTITTGSPNVKIGIIEKGFDLGHYELKHMRIISGRPKYDFIKKSQNHGNMVAGIIGARANNNKGIAGVLWEADCYGFIIHSELDLINAISEASKREVSIVNISLIFGGWGNEGKKEFNQKVFDQLKAQFIWLVSNFPDIIFIQAAGNNPKVGVDKMPLASLAVEFDNVITVGSIKQEGHMVKEHTSGEGVSIAAPGFDIRSTKSTDLGSRLLPGLFDNTYETDSGTSFATPFVTGVAGLILSVAPDLSPGEVKHIIMDSAQDHVFDDSNFPLGTGVVDAYAAVLMAFGDVPPDEVDEPDLPPPAEDPEESGQRFLTLPFKNSEVKIVAGWLRNNGASHHAIDYVLGGDTAGSWNKFEVVAAANGVAMQNTHRGEGFGNYVVIRHDKTNSKGENYYTIYAHLESVYEDSNKEFLIPTRPNWDQEFNEWKPVKMGQTIGFAGDSGSAGKGIHLHFEVFTGKVGSFAERQVNQVDPYDIYGQPSAYPQPPDVTTGSGQNHLWLTGLSYMPEDPDPSPPPVEPVPKPPQQLSSKVISAGHEFSLALKADGTVWAWGRNSSGQLGDGTSDGKHKPVQVSGLNNIVAISAGYDHALALKSDGTVWAWGRNIQGQVGDSCSDPYCLKPVQVAGLNNVVAISAGGSHSLALSFDGSVWAWGVNTNWGFRNIDSFIHLSPVQVEGLNNVLAVSAGNDHSLALLSDGIVLKLNRLGRKEYSLNNHIDISAGSDYALALGSDGTVWGWGTSSNAPWDFSKGGIIRESQLYYEVGMYHALAISAGFSHALALKSDGTVWAFGNNSAGQLGIGSSDNYTNPIQVIDLKDVVAISAGGFHSLTLKSDGTVWVWGSNRRGQLGVEGIDKSFTPVQVKINLGAQ